MKKDSFPFVKAQNIPCNQGRRLDSADGSVFPARKRAPVERKEKMRKTALYIGMSLDGYIADPNGGVDWMTGQDESAENGDSYENFIKTVDTVIMGWNTYHQITTELSAGEWVYEGLTSWVITHRTAEEKMETAESPVLFTDRSPCDLVRNLKKEEGKNIWICGGADVVRQLMEEDLIDIYHISILPILLGDGIRLFQTSEKEKKLRLIRVGSENGITELVYLRRHFCRNVCANACGNICKNVHENGIRKFTTDDMERVMEIWLNGNLEAHAFIPRKYWESNAEAVKEQLLEAEVFVCEKEGRIEGFAGLQGNYLAGIFVEAGYRSKGIGRELLNRVKETHPVFSLHVYAENERAVSFYRREGLKVVSREMEKDTGREEYTMEWRASAARAEWCALAAGTE